MKKALNLSEGFAPLNGAIPINFETKQFLGGERHFKIHDTNVEDGDELLITARLNGAEDIMLVIVATDAARRLGYEKISLVAPYFPAARQDRVCNEGEAFTLKIMADLVNQCHFDKVYIFSPHSDVTPALLNNVEILDLDAQFIQKIIQDHIQLKDNIVNIICPDAGARKRVEKITQQLYGLFTGVEFRVIGCEKLRDVRDGQLKGFFVNSIDLGGRPSIILDDIIAMGGTFIGLAKALQEKGCGSELYLYTSHADCQAGLDNVAPHFKRVFTTNSKHDFAESKGITVFGINL